MKILTRKDSLQNKSILFGGYLLQEICVSAMKHTLICQAVVQWHSFDTLLARECCIVGMLVCCLIFCQYKFVYGIPRGSGNIVFMCSVIVAYYTVFWLRKWR